MKDRTKIPVKSPIVSLVTLLAGSLLLGFSAGRWLAPAAAWIGPALLIRYARDHRAGRGFLLVFAAYILAFLIGFGAMWHAAWGTAAMAILAILYALLWSLPILADRLLTTRLRGYSGTFVFPLAATTLEFLNTHTNPVGTWGATGFSQYGNLPLMQLASVTGMIGITFLMGWFASVVNWAWENRGRGDEVLRGVTTFGAVLSVVLAFGFVRLNLAPIDKTDGTVRVAGITAVSGLDYDTQEKFLSAMDSIRDAYFGATVREAQAGAKVILWHELAGRGPASDEADLIARAQDVARQNDIYLYLPLGTFYPPETGKLLENELLVIDPTGSIVIDHIKFGGQIFEGAYRIQGDGKLQTVSTPFGVLSGAICYDMDYPTIIQQSGQNKTGLMIVPSSDWLEIDPVHSHMAVFRAIENGMSLVRQTHTGLSIAVDPYGRVLAQTDFFGATDRTLVAQVPVRHVPTLYTAFGRWFEWLCVAGFLLFLAGALITRRQVK